MKTTEAIQDKLQLLYALQKEQEAQVSAGIAKLSSVLTPGHLISELIGSVVQKAPQSSPAEQPNYSPLWDKLTDQVGITSPVAKSTIHLVLDQLMTKWLNEQATVKKEDQAEKKDMAEKTVKKIPQLDHSLNHF
jgi:hypothetical protein